MRCRLSPTKSIIGLALAFHFATWHFAEAGEHGPDPSWSQAESMESLIGKYAGVMELCGYYGEASELKNITKMLPKWKWGFFKFDYEFLGNCAEVKEEADRIFLSRKDFWIRFLSSKYKTPAVASPQPVKPTECQVGGEEQRRLSRSEVHSLLLGNTEVGVLGQHSNPVYEGNSGQTYKAYYQDNYTVWY